MSHRKLCFAKTEWIALTDKYSDPELARMFNVHTNAILYWRTKLKIPPKHKYKRRKTYQINESFFSNIKTENQAYILGFFTGDGNVHTNGRSISISVSVNDQEILVKIRKAMNGNMPIHIVSNSRGFNPKGENAILDLCRKNFVKDLAKFGIYPNKTFNLRYPNIPKELDKHFIRGLWDADGSINKMNFDLCGASFLILDVRNKIRDHTNHLIYKHPNRRFRIWGFRRDKSVVHWLYQGATIYLARKHYNFLKYWS